MADISKITLPNNQQYDLKDSYARTHILNHIVFSTTQPESTTQVAGDIWVVLQTEEE